MLLKLQNSWGPIRTGSGGKRKEIGGGWKYHVCQWECQCHDLRGEGKKRSVSGALILLSICSRFCDTRSTGGYKTLQGPPPSPPPLQPLQTRNKSTTLVFWLRERHTAWIINKRQTITISCLSESCHLSVAGIKNSVELLFQQSNAPNSHKDEITSSLRTLSKSRSLCGAKLFHQFPLDGILVSSAKIRCWFPPKYHQDNIIACVYFAIKSYPNKRHVPTQTTTLQRKIRAMWKKKTIWVQRLLSKMNLKMDSFHLLLFF